MASGSFTTSSWIVGGRVRHDINLDHYGDLSSLNVVLAERLGQLEPHTPLHYVLDWLVQRMIKLESSNHFGSAFSANAYILGLGDTIDIGGGEIHGVIGAFATVLDHSGTKYIYIDAILNKSFTVNAVIRAQQEIPVNAVIV
jgi:hypothetical protein